MQLFIAGLKPALRTELMKSNPASMEEALNAALDAEKILMEPRRSGHPAQLAPIDQVEDEVNEDVDEYGAEQEEEEDAEILAVTTRLRNLKKKASQRKSKSGGGGRKPGKKQQPQQPGKQQQPPSSNGSQPNNVDRDACRYCSKKGHFQANCFKRKADGAPMMDQFGRPYQAWAPVNTVQQQQQDAATQQQMAALLRTMQSQQSAYNPYSHYTQGEQSGGGGVGSIWNKQPWERLEEGGRTQMQFPPPHLNY
jgi:hypothetical protein